MKQRWNVLIETAPDVWEKVFDSADRQEANTAMVDYRVEHPGVITIVQPTVYVR